MFIFWKIFFKTWENGSHIYVSGISLVILPTDIVTLQILIMFPFCTFSFNPAVIQLSFIFFYVAWTRRRLCRFLILPSMMVKNGPLGSERWFRSTCVILHFTSLTLKQEGSYHPHTDWRYQFSSVSQSCLTLCNPMDCSMPGFPVHHQLPEPTQIHVHHVGEAIQPSHSLSSPSPPAFNLSQHQGLF